MLRTQSLILMGGGLVVRLDNDALADSSSTPTDAAVGYKVDADGYIYTYEGVAAIYVQQYKWMVAGANTDFQVRVTRTGNATSGSAESTWLDTTSDSAWTLGVSISGASKSSSLLVELRNKATTAVFSDTATVTMDVDES